LRARGLIFLIVHACARARRKQPQAGWVPAVDARVRPRVRQPARPDVSRAWRV